MISKILDVFKERVTYHDWIDNKTTEEILDKVVKTLTSFIWKIFIRFN